MNSKQNSFIIAGKGFAEEMRAKDRRSLRWSELQITHLYATNGEEIVINVEGPVEENAYIMIGVPGMGATNKVRISEGENKITSPHDGLISFVNNNEVGEYVVSVQSTHGVIPFFKLGVNSDEDWKSEYSASDAKIVALSGEYADVIVYKNDSGAVSKIASPTILMTEFDNFLKTQYLFSGLVKGGRADYKLDENKALHIEGGSYMSATHGHTSYKTEPALKRLLDPVYNRWGIWHENGHQHQLSHMKWADLTEVTVNIYSLESQLEANGVASGLDKAWPIINSYLQSENRNFDEIKDNGGVTKFLIKLGMFWQLRLTFGNEFYPQLHQYYRLLPSVPSNSEEIKQEFIVSTSKIAGINLIPFYLQWGVVPNEKTIDRLSVYPVLETAIWNNSDHDFVSLPIPNVIYIPELANIKRDVSHFEIAATKITHSLGTEWLLGYKYIFKINGTYRAEVNNGSPAYYVKKETIGNLTYLTANTGALKDSDVLEIELRLKDSKHSLFKRTVSEHKAWLDLNKLFVDLTYEVLAEDVNQEMLDGTYEAIIASTYESEQDRNAILSVWKIAERKYLSKFIDDFYFSAEVRSEYKEIDIGVTFSGLGLNNYEGYEFLLYQNDVLLCNLKNGVPTPPSRIDTNRWECPTSAIQEDEFVFAATYNGFDFSLSTVSYFYAELAGKINGLYIDHFKKEISPEVTQSYIDELRFFIAGSNLINKYLIHLTSAINEAQRVFLMETVVSVNLGERVNVEFSSQPNRSYQSNFYALILNGSYQSEINKGKPGYSTIQGNIWQTKRSTSGDDTVVVEVRRPEGKYIVYSKNAHASFTKPDLEIEMD